MRIFHIALDSDWRAALRSGSYTTSTLGMSLEQVGFIHAAREDQVHGVWRDFYAGKGLDLVLLGIDTDRLTSPWSEDVVPEKGTTFPHIHGPLDVGAVTTVSPLDRNGGTPPFLVLLAREVLVRGAIAIAVMMLGVLGVAIGHHVRGAWSPFLGGVLGLVVGAVLVAVTLRWRRAARGR